MLVAGALLASIAALGCGSSGGSSSCDGGCWQPTPADQTFIDGFCGLREPCCTQAGLRAAPNPTACAASLQRRGFSRDDGLRSACLSELQQLAGSTSCVPEIWNLDDPCVRTFDEPSGPQAPGKPCATSADCAGTAGAVTTCTPDPSDPALARTICLQARAGAAGDHPCLGNVTADGLVNAAPILVNQQSPPISSGFVCPSRAGVHCDFDTDTCASLLPDGSPCTYLDVCASGSCLTATFAHATDGNPGSCAGVVPAGQPCSNAPSVCDGTSFCDVANGGVCALRLSAGVACTDDSQCLTSNCSVTTLPSTCSPRTSAEDLALFGFCG